MRGIRLVVIAVIAASALGSGGAHATGAPTVREHVRDTLSARLTAEGIEPSSVLDREATLRVWFPDGTERTYTRTVREVLAEMTPPGKIENGTGPAGTPEIVVGNTTHIFLDLYFGSTSGAVCGGITVTDSATVPHTPTVIQPVPGPWPVPAYSVGGPTRHVTGSYNLMGLHTVGTLIGSAASTASGAPSPAPVWLPLAHTGFVSDASVDFLGHAQVFQQRVRLDFFGTTICLTVGGMLLSDGIAIFDNRPIQGQTIGFPNVP